MALGLVGRKVGMTRVFTDDGDSVPVTVVEVVTTAFRKSRPPKTMATPLFK